MRNRLSLFVCGMLLSVASFAAAPTWSVNPASFTYGMTVTAVAEVDCDALENPSSMIGAFVGADCRGVANTSNIINGKYVAFMTVYSNSASGETITFKLYDATNDAEEDASTTILFQDGAAYGFPTTPFEIKTNEEPTAIDLSSSEVTETISNPTVGTLSTTDTDGGTFTYTLVSGDGDDDNDQFDIAGAVLSVDGTLNYETASSYSIRVRSADGGCAVEETFTIAVKDTNDAPTALGMSSTDVDENMAIGSTVGDFEVTDEDGSDTHSYALVAGAGDTDNAQFVISGSALKTAAEFNYESQASYSVRVEVTDQGSETVEQAFTISVNDVNDEPTDINLTATSFKENKPSGSTIATLSATDEDGADVHSFAFNADQASDNASFNIVGTALKTNASFNYEEDASYTVRITATDLEGASFTEQIIIQVADSNDAPTAMSLTNNSIFESAASGSFVGKFLSEDEDAADTYTYALVAGSGDADNASFTISNDTLYSNTALDYNTKDTYYIRTQTTDAGGLSYARRDTIHVKNSNDAPTDIVLSDHTVAENLAASAEVGTLTSVDPDAGDGHTYELVAGTGDTDNGSFTISDNKLVTGAKFDFETKASYSVRIESTDFSGLSYEEALTITVTDANDAPTAIGISTDSLDENVSANTVLLTFSSTDQDAGAAHTYEFDNTTSNDNDEFTIVNNELRASSAIDFEAKNVYFIKVITNDGNGGTFSAQKVLYVRDGNDGPTAMALSNNDLDENLSSGTLIGLLSTTDQDAGDNFTYTTVSGSGSADNASVTISNDSLYSAASFDFETKSSYAIRIRSTDSGSATTESTYTITINDANDAPTDLGIDNTSVDENLNIGAVVGDLSVNDVDASDDHTYALVAGTGDTDNASFAISGDQLVTKAKFDFETKSAYSVRVQVTDIGGEVYAESISVSINDANDAPTALSISTDTIDENVSLNAVLLTLSATDVDAGATHTFVFDNSSSSDNDQFSIVNNELRSNAAIDFETKNVYFVRVTADDGNGGTFTAQKILFVRDGNDGPTAQALSENEIVENSPSSTFIGVLSTTDVDATDNFTYTLVAGTGSAGNGSFTISNDTLYSATSFDFETKASYAIRVKTTDKGGQSVEAQYTIAVIDDNDAPTDIQLDNASIDENLAASSVVGNLSVSDVDADDTHTYTLVAGTGDTDNAQFKIVGTEIQSKVKFDHETKSAYSVRVKVTDAAGESYEEAFALTVEDANDAPTAISLDTDTVSENLQLNTAVIIFSSTDQDPADVHTYSFDNSTSNDNDAFTIVNNELRVNAAIDYETKNVYFIKVISDDGNGGTFTSQKILHIRDENDAPTASALSNATIEENNVDGAMIGLFSTTDADAGDSFTYSLVAGTGDAGNSAFTIVGDTLTATDSLDFETKASYSIRVAATDADGASFTTVYQITVTDGNDQATSVNLSYDQVEENAGIGTEIGSLSTTDPDATDSYSYALVAGTGGDDNAKFNINAGKLVTKAIFDFETKSSYTVRVRSTDQGGLTVENVFVVGITDTNDDPTAINLDTDTISENLAPNTSVIMLSATDQDTADIHVFELVEDDESHNNLFTIINNEIKIKNSFNYELSSLYFIHLKVTDGAGSTLQSKRAIYIRDENDGPTAVDLEGREVDENNAPSTFVGLFGTTDEDDADTFTYSLVSGNGDVDNASFTITGDSLFMADSTDFEAKSVYALRVETSDAAGATHKGEFVVNVVDKNDVPTALTLSSTSFTEGNESGTTVAILTTTDQDANDVHTYSLISGTGDTNNGSFYFDGNELKANVVADFESVDSYSIRIQSSDLGGGSTDSVLTITVEDLNEAPVIRDTILFVSENAVINQLIGSVTYSDVDEGDDHHLTILNHTGFMLSDINLVLMSVLDYETTPTYELLVEIEDDGGLLDTAVVEIIVEDEIELNDPLPVNKMVSPNGDGKNDEFAIDNVEIYSNYSLKIFNNVGVVVFEVDANYANDWDGTFKGKSVEPGVYYYLFQNNDDSADYFTGSVSIIK